MQKFYKILLSTSFFTAIISVVLYFMGFRTEIGPLVITVLFTLAIGMRGIPILKDFSFTIWILMAVSSSLFYPQHFISIGDFQTKALIIPLLQLIMFGMGTEMSLKDFAGIVKTPKNVIVGFIGHFMIMPLTGFVLASLVDVPDDIAAGIILVGCAPSGLASNVMVYIAGANLPLSVTITAVNTLAAPIMTPLLMKLLAGQMVPIDLTKMMFHIVEMVIAPIILGLIFNKLFKGKISWLDKALPIFSMAGIAIIISIITALGRDSLLQMGLILIVVVIIHNTAGYFFGYWGAKLFKMDEASCRTVAIEVGLQNAGLASGIALQMGKVATLGLASAVFGPWMNISGSALANYWRTKTVKEKN